MEKNNQNIEFIETLTQTDMIEFNYYLLKSNKMIRINTIIIGVISIVLGIISMIVDNTHTYLAGDICLIVVGLYALFLLIPTIKLGIKIKMSKNKQALDMKPIYCSIDDNEICYCFEDEKTTLEKSSYAIPYGSIQKAVQTKKFIYIHVNPQTIIIIKSSECPYLDEVISIFIKNLGSNKRFFKKN